jgi:hypothetical protein
MQSHAREDGVSVEALIRERFGGHHQLFVFSIVSDEVGPIERCLEGLTSGAADPAAEAARLIQLAYMPPGGDGGMTPLGAAAAVGNTPVLSFLAAHPGVDLDYVAPHCASSALGLATRVSDSSQVDQGGRRASGGRFFFPFSFLPNRLITHPSSMATPPPSPPSSPLAPTRTSISWKYARFPLS